MWPRGLWLMALGLLKCLSGLHKRLFLDGYPRRVRLVLAVGPISFLLVCQR
jgi:hypothetical protein